MMASMNFATCKDAAIKATSSTILSDLLLHGFYLNTSDRAGVDPGVGKGRGTNRLSVTRWLEKKLIA